MGQTAVADWWRTWRRSRADRQARSAAAHRLYDAVVRQARQPVFYVEWGVPDTRGGRLELLNLHAILVMRRLRLAGPEGEELSQALFDLLFADLDRHLREWGVGDLSVGKHVKKLAESFFGRAKAVHQPLDDADIGSLAAILRRNVYEGEPQGADGARELATYLLGQERQLAACGPEILAGEVAFASLAEPGTQRPGGG